MIASFSLVGLSGSAKKPLRIASFRSFSRLTLSCSPGRNESHYKSHQVSRWGRSHTCCHSSCIRSLYSPLPAFSVVRHCWLPADAPLLFETILPLTFASARKPFLAWLGFGSTVEAPGRGFLVPVFVDSLSLELLICGALRPPPLPPPRERPRGADMLSGNREDQSCDATHQV